ncbi:MAG: ribonuclease III [Patescibacteria group bacterium]
MPPLDLVELEGRIDFRFNDRGLGEVALTHRSYLNEAPEQDGEHNERLEFLGDAVLELVVTEYLFHRYPDKQEGELTNWRSAIVRGEVLSQAGGDIDLGRFLKMSRGEEQSGGRDRQVLIANTFEAVIGAIYVDQGYGAAKKFIDQFLLPRLDEIINQNLHIDSKSHLQELTQERLGVTPNYRVVKEDGPDHDKQFTVAVFIKDQEIASGQGPSKQRAEQATAANALSNQDWLEKP